MSIHHKIVEAFAESILAKVCLIRESNLPEREKQRVMESISDDIKKFTDCVAPRVSVAAHEEATKRHVKLSGMGWHDQPQFDKGRKLFHREHLIPVGAIRDKCLKADSISYITEALNSATVAWILKSEDRQLTKLGFRSNRPDPALAYQKAGILLMT